MEEPGPVTPVSHRTRLAGPYPRGTITARGPTPRSSLHAVASPTLQPATPTAHRP